MHSLLHLRQRNCERETEVICVSTEEILQFSQDNAFEDCVAITGISKMHVISVISEKANFW